MPRSNWWWWVGQIGVGVMENSENTANPLTAVYAIEKLANTERLVAEGY